MVYRLRCLTIESPHLVKGMHPQGVPPTECAILSDGSDKSDKSDALHKRTGLERTHYASTPCGSPGEEWWLFGDPQGVVGVGVGCCTSVTASRMTDAYGVSTPAGVPRRRLSDTDFACCRMCAILLPVLVISNIGIRLFFYR